MHGLTERLLKTIRKQQSIRAGDRLAVAVSGGADSVALLCLLLELRSELGTVLSVAHVNHKLRGEEADEDERFVAKLARQHGLELHACEASVDGSHTSGVSSGIEAAARELRYSFFRQLAREAGVTKIATAHTLDDQAETVLMRMIRGSGVRGLGGIHPRIVVEDEDGEFSGEILRPLLAIRRRELEQYLNDIGQTWREDSSNAEDRFTRNRVRKLVVPLLEHEFNPAVAENLAELAEIARGEQDYWDNEVSGWLGTTVQWSEPDWARAASQSATLVQIAPLSGKASVCSDEHEPPSDIRSRIDNAHGLVMNASVSRIWFLGEPVAVQRRLVKAVGEHARIPLEFKHIEEILRAAAADEASGKELSLPLGWKLVVEPEQLAFVTPDLRDAVAPKDYEYELRVPGEVMVYEAGSSIEVLLVPAGAEAGYNLDHLLDSLSLPGPLRVRNWRPGERFWPAHTKSPKKIKELLQERHIAQPQRRLWPVVVSGNEIVWMRGFSPPAKLLAAPGRAGVAIVDKPLPARLTTGL